MPLSATAAPPSSPAIDLPRSAALITDRSKLMRSLAADSLEHFVRQSWHVLEPSRPIRWNWHLSLLCRKFEAVSRGEIKRIRINVPPGTGKSLLTTFWGAWEWIDNPHYRYLRFSYTQDNTIEDNRRLRALVTSDWYQENFPLEVSSDQNAKIRFDTVAGGYSIASSVGGLATGKHPHRIIIDDPHKAADARSLVQLEADRQWYKRTIPTRISLDPAIVLIMQRLHMLDMSGYIESMRSKSWVHVILPMRYDPQFPSPPDPEDIRTQPGELLFPGLFDEEAVREEEKFLEEFGTAGQLQQNPVPEGGALMKEENFIRVSKLPVAGDMVYVRGWDTADTDKNSKNYNPKSNWTVGVKIAYHVPTSTITIVDVIREQLDPGPVHDLIVSTARADGHHCYIGEGEGVGKSITTMRSRVLVGYMYFVCPEKESKVKRAGAFISQLNMKNVRVLDTPANKHLADYLAVMTSFPVGTQDDDVDGTSNSIYVLMKIVGINADDEESTGDEELQGNESIGGNIAGSWGDPNGGVGEW